MGKRPCDQFDPAPTRQILRERPVRFGAVVAVRLPAEAASELRRYAEFNGATPGGYARLLILNGLRTHRQPTDAEVE